MEKLLEFKKGKLWEENTKYYRFQCDCLMPADAMDIAVNSWGDNDEAKYIILSMPFTGTGLWGRIKYAWQILLGNWGWRDFCVRQEDASYLSDIFNPLKKYSELP